MFAGVAAAVIALAAGFGGAFNDETKVPGTDSQAAYDLLAERFPEAAGDSATIVFFREDGGTLKSADSRAAMQATSEAIARQPNVVSAISPTQPEGAQQVSPDGRIAFTSVQYDEPAAELGKEPFKRLEAAAEQAKEAGVSTAMNGAVVANGDVHTPLGELIGIAVAILVLSLVFRSVVAMFVTMAVSIVSLGIALGLITFGAGLVTVSSSVSTLAIMLGLGVGIDYALLVMARYREARSRGDDTATGAARANATAGATIVTAGAIVVVAISGLLVVGIPFTTTMGIGTAVAVAVVAVGAATVLPWVFGALGDRLLPKGGTAMSKPPKPAAAMIGLATRRPVPVTLLVGTVLLAFALPVTGLRLGNPDDGVKAADNTQRIAYDKLAEGFGVGTNGPFLVAASTARGDLSAMEKIAEAAEQDPGVASVTPPQPNPGGDAAILSIVPTTSPQDAKTSDLLDRLRDDTIPAATSSTSTEAYVGGFTASQDDLASKISSRLIPFIAVVITLAVVLLMAAFRSLRVPLISAGFNLLSIGAAYGLMVLVFQEGIGSSLIGVSEEIPIPGFIPLFMFAILFGLSMDYNVFQLSRVREEWAHGVEAREAVRRGANATAKVIAAAGIIMVSVFGGFVIESDVTIKSIGFGLAVAIFVDVLLVRFLLAPAVMTLLGEKAWDLPRWLDKVLPSISLEGDESVVGPPPAPAPPSSLANGHAPVDAVEPEPAATR